MKHFKNIKSYDDLKTHYKALLKLTTQTTAVTWKP